MAWSPSNTRTGWFLDLAGKIEPGDWGAWEKRTTVMQIKTDKNAALIRIIELNLFKVTININSL